MNCHFLARQIEKEHIHLDFELFYVIDGKVSFHLENKEYILHKDDFLIVNTDTMHKAIIENDAIACRIEIPFLEFSNLTSRNSFVFWCNSVTDSGESYDYTRDIIRKIIWEEHRENSENRIYLTSLYYQLLDIVVNDFSVSNDDGKTIGGEHKFDERKQQIEDYIRKNYNKDISLQTLADNLYLSVAYLSKYIKKQFGISFIEYVNNLRFNAAVSQLLYSDKSVLRIAMDNGFSSSATLNKMFRDRYNKTPTEFRSEWRDKETRKSNTFDEEKKIREKINKYFEQNPEEHHDRNMINYESVIVTDSSEKIHVTKSWSKMLNIGTATDLLNSNIQKHVLALKSQLNIQYIRFWDLYAKEMYIFPNEDQPSFNFDNLDRIIDFLIDNNLKPYIELGNKPKILIKNSKKRMMYSNADDFDRIRNNMQVFIEKMIIHLINRYTPEEVETWYFELWKEEIEPDSEGKVEFIDINRKYLEDFDMIYGIIHRLIPGCNVGGGGFSLRFGEEALHDIFSQWERCNNKPDFITMYNFPYTNESVTGKRSQSLDTDFFREHVLRMKAMLKKYGFENKPLHVSEWSFSVSSRNVLNDHCMNGAYIMKNMIDCFDLCDMYGYWVATDLFSNYYDTNRLLNGASGLLTKDGIPKPSCYALDFLNRLGRWMWYRGPHCIVTSNSGQNWRIACHNLKSLSYQYSKNYEDELTIENCEKIFTDMKKTHIHFELPIRDSNKYNVRIYSVNKKFGSIQDEWAEMMTLDEMRLEDMRYISRITTPKMSINKCDVKKGYIIIDAVLEPNEIVFMHVIKKY